MQHEIILCEDSHLGRKGQRVTLSLQPTDVHQAEELATYLGGFKAPDMRADEVSQVILVDHDTDYIRNFSSNNTFRRVNVKTSKEGPTPEVDAESSLSTYNVVDRALGSFINDITMQNATKSLDPLQASMMRIQIALALDREIDTWTELTTLASWATGNRVTLAAGFQWNEGASANPIKDLHTRIEASAQRVTGIWLGQHTANAFTRSPSVRDQMRMMLGDGPSQQIIGSINDASNSSIDFSIPGLPPFHVVAGKVYNETTTALDWIIGDDVVLNTSPPGIPTNGESIATSYTYRRRGSQGVGVEIRQYRVEGRGPKGGTMVVANVADDILITGNTCGGLIKAAYQ